MCVCACVRLCVHGWMGMCVFVCVFGGERGRGYQNFMSFWILQSEVVSKQEIKEVGGLRAWVVPNGWTFGRSMRPNQYIVSYGIPHKSTQQPTGERTMLFNRFLYYQHVQDPRVAKYDEQCAVLLCGVSLIAHHQFKSSCWSKKSSNMVQLWLSRYLFSHCLD